ncbi:MAG: DUF2339 domain-containing protein [Gammaproteobacteria bacterium]|nr:MAG: DUF2339 domain-containing protein [Gammaproteobacteria bacterium]
MLFVIVGLLVGTIFGSIFLDYQGSVIGAIIGGLAGLIFHQIKRIGLLQTSVKTLAEEQTSMRAQLTQLQNNIQQRAQPNEQHDNLAVVSELNESASVIKTQSPTINKNESAELDLPDDQLADPWTSDQQSLAQKPNLTTAHKIASVDATSQAPGIGDKIFSAVRRFFTEGNPIVRIGMVVMFFGVSFLVKYASGQGLFPIEFRLTGVIVGAIALLIVGWKTRARPGSYGLVLQGGGIAVIYLTLFAAAKIYGLIPLGLAFGLLFLVVVLGVLLALLQNAQVLAILATAGGFLAPILTSTGEGSHVGLFSFYLILNLGILAIAVYKAWRLLNWVGFMFTFVITAVWGVLKYEPLFYASTQPFLIAFFALYLTVSILFSFKQPTNLKGVVDGSLVFGLPLVAFGLQTALLKHTEYGLAISAIVLAMIYIILSAGLARRHLQTHRVLVESFLALGISFATLAVPLALDASWTSVTWALEATGLIWVGLRQQRLRPRVVGYLLHCAAVFSLLAVKGLHTGLVPILNGDFIGVILLALTSFTIAYLLHYFVSVLTSFEKIITPIAVALGVLWWFVAGINEMSVHILPEYLFAAVILLSAISSLIIMLVSKKLTWRLLSNSVFALLPFVWALSILVFAFGQNGVHPLQVFSFFSIAVMLAVQYRFLFSKESEFEGKQNILLRIWHTFTAWAIFAIIFWEVSWQTSNISVRDTTNLIIWFAAIVVPVILLLGAGQKKFWPFISFERDYKNWIPAPLFALAAIWFLVVCNRAPTLGEHYLPVLNPLDLAQFAVILIFAYAIKRDFMNQVNFISKAARVGLLGIMLFVWVNVVTLRAVSHYQYIPYEFDSLWNAMQVQMALSILWSICALVVMNLSRRIQRRELWMIGAGLLGLVVLKLATKDLSGSGTLAGIISFMVVGALMLLIGFLSPIPAKKPSSISIDDEIPLESLPVGNKGPLNE